jgi:WD40 repeat protein
MAKSKVFSMSAGSISLLALASTAYSQGPPPFIWTQDVIDGGAQALDFSPNGALLAVGDGVSGQTQPGQGYGQGSVRLLSVRNGETLQVRGPIGAGVPSVSFSPSGSELAVGGLFRAIFTVPSLATARNLPPDQYPYRVVCWSPDGAKIAIATNSPFDGARIVDAGTGLVLQYLPYATEVADMAFSPDGQYLAVSRQDIQIYRTSDYTILRFIPNVNGSTFRNVDWAPDSRRLAAMRWPVYQDPGDIRVYDAIDGSHLLTMPNGGNDFLTSIDWSPDNRLIGLSAIRGAGASGVLALFNADTGALVRRYEQGLDNRSYIMKFSPNSQTVAVGHNSSTTFRVSLVQNPIYSRR